MGTLRIVPGDGRLLRTDRYIAFAVQPDRALFDAVQSEGDAFKKVAEHVVSQSFQVPDFAVIDLSAGTVLAFGETILESSDGTTYSAAATSTWSEHTVDLHRTLSCTPADAGPVADSWLHTGCVPAGGFVLANDDESVTIPEPEQGRRDDRPTADEVDDEEPVPEPDVVATAADVSAGNPRITNFDPLEEPDHIDLERLGSAVVDRPEPGPSRTEVGPQNDHTNDLASDQRVGDSSNDPTSAMKVPAPETLIPPVPGALGAAVPGGEAGDEPDEKWAPPEVPPIASFPPPPTITSAEPLLPAARSSRLTLRFDDGQVVHVERGVYVGRRPSKRGLPDNFESVVVRGEHVSRVHWELSIEAGQAVVRDLGSQSGTTVQTDDQVPRPVTETGSAISPGSVIRFADRWAVVELTDGPGGG